MDKILKASNILALSAETLKPGIQYFNNFMDGIRFVTIFAYKYL